MFPKWIYGLMAEERARQCSTSYMLDGMTRDSSRGALGYCASACRFRDIKTGKFVSREYKRKYCENNSIQRALNYGGLSSRLNN